MPAYIIEWLDLTFRWLHVIVGVAWIGTSFYFVWLENMLDRKSPDLPEGVEGDLWAIHGGGFYYLRKFEVAPAKLPETLHWFKWEAYATWITGLCMLTVVYYLNAEAMMVDPAVASVTTWGSIGIGVGAIIAGWLVYDGLCRTPLLKRPTLFLAVMFGLMVAASWGLTELLSHRAAYIHVGAMLGTMMAGNVFFVIIPNQKRLVDAAEAGGKPDAAQAAYASLRSRHNNYFTLPVLFIMVSNHFSMTYGPEYAWAILAVLSAVSIGIRHHFNVRHRTNRWAWTMPFAALAIASLAFVTAPGVQLNEPDPKLAKMEPVAFEEVQTIIAARCAQCHATEPSSELFYAPPQGVVFETPEQIERWAHRIKIRVYDDKTMPLANRTKMTEEEREKVAAWVYQGANIE